VKESRIIQFSDSVGKQTADASRRILVKLTESDGCSNGSKIEGPSRRPFFTFEATGRYCFLATGRYCFLATGRYCFFSHADK
jgi:hypothetical protein